MNNNLILISGKTATGKSLSLRNIPNPDGVFYLNCENNKGLPFKSGFQEFTVTDPKQVYEAFVEAENRPNVHTLVIDTATFMMDMYETMYVNNSPNTMKAWGEYAQFFKTLMSQYVANSTKNIIFLAHTMDVMNEAEMVNETLVKVKGSLMNQGIESFFSTVISTKKVPLKVLKDMKSDMLNITEEEEMLGFKYVFQTRLTKETVNERIRSSMGMWKPTETFIDNDVSIVLAHIHKYYN